MVLLGLLLVAAAVGITVDVFVENTAHIDVDVLGRTYAVAPGWLVVTGIGAVVVFLIGARLIAFGVGRARSRRTALRAAVAATQDRDRLAQQLAAERAEHEPQAPAAEADPLQARHEDSRSAGNPAPA